MHTRITNASATLVLLICLTLTCFNIQTFQADTLPDTDSAQQENISISQNENHITSSGQNTETTEDSDTPNGVDNSKDPTLELLTAASIGTRYINNYRVNFRTQPSYTCDIIELLNLNDEVELLLEESGEFYCVRYNGVVGYIHHDYLSESAIEYSQDLQQRVADIARYNQGTMPCTGGFCARWVSGVYQAAGLGYPGGNAIDFWTRWSYSGSTSMDNIPVGAVVVGSGSGSEAGNKYGHVGIYLGDGMVADNVGCHRVMSLEEWAAYQVGYCNGYQGYIGWVWPYGQPY